MCMDLQTVSAFITSCSNKCRTPTAHNPEGTFISLFETSLLLVCLSVPCASTSWIWLTALFCIHFLCRLCDFVNLRCISPISSSALKTCSLFSLSSWSNSAPLRLLQFLFSVPSLTWPCPSWNVAFPDNAQLRWLSWLLLHSRADFGKHSAMALTYPSWVVAVYSEMQHSLCSLFTSSLNGLSSNNHGHFQLPSHRQQLQLSHLPMPFPSQWLLFHLHSFRNKVIQSDWAIQAKESKTFGISGICFCIELLSFCFYSLTSQSEILFCTETMCGLTYICCMPKVAPSFYH